MGNAKNHSFHHNDLKDLENRIARLRKKASVSSACEIYVVTEAVFSMDGDMPNLIKISEICFNYNCKLIVDEAHSIGVCGLNGLGRVLQLGLVDRVFALIVTFGKALGSHGAAILGTAALKSFLVNFSRSFIYTTALPSHTIANTIAGFEYIKSEVGEEERKSLLSNISFFKDLTTKLELDQSFIPGNSAIHSCIIKGNFKVKSVSRQLQAKGYDVRAILYPTVPKELERLRFCLHSFNTKTEIEGVLLQLSKIIK
jgi:8-amino-7-oxononanoate synthase